jgi:hypothetical protein
MGWLDSFFDPGEGYAKGQDQLDKYYQEGQSYYNPIINLAKMPIVIIQVR